MRKRRRRPFKVKTRRIRYKKLTGKRKPYKKKRTHKSGKSSVRAFL